MAAVAELTHRAAPAPRRAGRRCARGLALLLAALGVAAAAQTGRSGGVRENVAQVERWNRFVEHLLAVHDDRAARRRLETRERVGGYGGALDDPDYFVEVEFRDAASGQLLSRIQREREHLDRIHAVDLFVYDGQGRVIRDYSATFLPGARNAPVQTLVNLHAYNGGLHAYRQFDASGNRIYERCSGSHFDDAVRISLDETRLPFVPANDDERENYLACFGLLATSAGPYLDPRVELHAAARGDAESSPRALVERGRVRFLGHDFEGADEDLSRAISLAPELDDAWFWRGMARGRARRLNAAIADLDVYLERRPGDPVGWTKRGIRHFWNGDEERAEQDFRSALRLDPGHAEAWDDLGVILARRGDLTAATRCFESAASLDPGYHKAHHNLALTLLMAGHAPRALAAVRRAMSLRSDDRDSVLLEAEILERLGRTDEARAARLRGGRLPPGNWSERAVVE